MSSTSEVESCKMGKKIKKTVSFNLKDISKDESMTVIDDDKDSHDDGDYDNVESKSSSHHTLTNKEENTSIQVRRVRQSIDLDTF